MPEGEFDEGVRAVQIEFRANVGAVIFHCPVRNKKLVGYFFARFIFGDHFQNFALGLGQIS